MKDASFGIIPICRDTKQDLFLIVQSQKTDEWTFPKGHAEHDESDSSAACRELKEETGISKIHIVENISYTDTYSFKKDGFTVEKTVTFFPAYTETRDVVIDKNEIQNYAWVTEKEAYKLLSFERPKEILKDLVAKLK